MGKEQTISDMKIALRKIQDENQDNFIDKLLVDIEYLLEKANARDYVPTDHEREAFRKILTIITNMNNWF